MSKMQSTETSLPLSRIRTIMKSSLDTGQINNEVLFLMTRATEMFIHDFTKEAYKCAGNTNNLRYEHLAEYVQGEDKQEFLIQVLPKKIKVKQFKEIIENRDSDETSGDSDDE